MEGQEELSTIMSRLETKDVASAELLAKVDGKIVKVSGDTLAKAADIPTKTSQLENDSSFTNKEYVDGMIGDVESLLAAL